MFDELSKRKLEFLDLVAGAETLSVRDAATRLGITHRTAEKHMEHIRDKTNLHTIAALTRAWTLHKGKWARLDTLAMFP